MWGGGGGKEGLRMQCVMDPCRRQMRAEAAEERRAARELAQRIMGYPRPGGRLDAILYDIDVLYARLRRTGLGKGRAPPCA